MQGLFELREFLFELDDAISNVEPIADVLEAVGDHTGEFSLKAFGVSFELAALARKLLLKIGFGWKLFELLSEDLLELLAGKFHKS